MEWASLGFPASQASPRRQTSMRRCVNDHPRAPGPFLGDGFRSRSGQPSSRTARSAETSRFDRRPPPQGTGRLGRLPRRPRRLRLTPRRGAARPRQSLRLPARRAAAIEERGLLPDECRRAAAGPPRGDRAAPRWSPLPLHNRRAGQGPDRGETGHRDAPVLRPLGPRGPGGGGPDRAPRGPLHQDGGDQGAAAVRTTAGFGDSTPADARPRGLDRARVRPPHRHAPKHGPSFARSGVRTREGGRPGRRHARRDRPAHRGPAPGPPRRRQAAWPKRSWRSLAKGSPAPSAAPPPRNPPTEDGSSTTATDPASAASPLALLPTEPPPPRRTGPREAIPAAVRRAVWERDHGRCQWPLDSGGRCDSTHLLELDHIDPWARDGRPTEANLRLLCHRHNALAARRRFGEAWMGRCTRSGTIRRRVAPHSE